MADLEVKNVTVRKQGKKIVDDTPQNLHQKFLDAKSFEDIFIRFYEDINEKGKKVSF